MSKKILVQQSVFIFRRLLNTTSTSFNLDVQSTDVKPFSQVPSLSAFEIIARNLPGGKFYNKSMKDLHLIMNAEFGNIVRFAGIFGRPPLLFVYDANDFEKTLRTEGVWPERIALESLAYYRKTKRPDIYNEYSGLFSAQGEEWHKMRTITNPILMQPKIIKLYCKQVDEIAKEFVGIMRKLRDEKCEMPADFSNYINSWSLESIVAIALERRLNILSGSSNDEKAQELIKNIRLFFEKSFLYDVLPSVWRYYETKGFKNFLKVYDTITNIVLHYIDIAIKEMEKSESSSLNHEDSILRKLLKIDKKAAVVMASDMLLAGVDTTATATINILYCLAKNPEKQDILRKELNVILPSKDTKITAQNMQNMPYLRAVIKETLRIMPVVSGTARKTGQDVNLSGYKVPAGTHVIMVPIFEMNDEKQYPQPEKYMPERWLRENNDPQCPHAKNANPFTFLPFGFGSRMCIGRRLAELEIEVLIANVIRNFKLEWHHPDMKIKSTFVNLPISDLKFKVIDA
ncbi:hypothetical protein PVAND_004973 [Polypedilum vanderplanki]|uniref:Cytochrome P450 CYP12A2-like n=1 Tax=Polypedilum vanderplanki TaxID=319348 RepID=A0A9J6BZ56_POLVA|nr:hypothetical protein PVAND_004973 [Polypedilum vanderplanki]